MVTIVLALGLLATACSGTETESGQLQPGDTPDATATPGESGNSNAGASNSGSTGTVTSTTSNEDGSTPDTQITITLSDAEGAGDDDPGAIERETTVEGTALDERDTAVLLGRLPDLVEQGDDRRDFSRPPETRPRPRPATTVEQAFPPDADAPPPDNVDSGPLQVLRFQPEGPVDLAPFISVTFNQPMIALGVLDNVEAADVPITITPEMPGRWIWLGTRTARFEYEPGAIDRIPAATHYTVEIPSGTTAASGAELGETVRFEFATPTVEVVSISGMRRQGMELAPLLVAQFNQRIDPSRVLEVTQLDANGERRGLRLASDEEVAERWPDGFDPKHPDRVMIFTPSEELPTDTEVTVQIGPGIPSLEGPDRSNDSWSEFGRTYGPLRFSGAICHGDCPPGSTMYIEFSNPLDRERFSSDMVTIDPPIPGAVIGVQGNAITIRGLSRGRTSYQFTVSGEVADIHGQRLRENVRATIRTGSAPPTLVGPSRQLVTLDPVLDDGRLSVSVVNHEFVALRVYDVDPFADWSEFSDRSWQLVREPNERDYWEPDWTLLTETLVETQAVEDEFTDVGIDLSSELAEADGHIVVVVQAPDSDDFWLSRPVVAWVQDTHLGLDTFGDDRQLIARVTDLRSGDPIIGGAVTAADGTTATTDADGLATLAISSEVRHATVSYEGDVALLGDVFARPSSRRDPVRWFVFDDRAIYKPGETVSVKGWIRSADSETPALLSIPDASEVSYSVEDPFGNRIAQGTADLSVAGGFDLSFEVPVDSTLGFAQIMLSGAGESHWHQFQIQEFRRPDFEVTTEIAADEPRFIGDSLRIDAQADYFAGGPLSGSEVEWNVTATATTHRPPGWSDYSFGIWTPWWFGGFARGFGGDFWPSESGVSEWWQGTTGATGEHGLDMTLTTDGVPRPVRINASATVFDVNRQPISSSSQTLMHPADLYVGLRTDRTFVSPGESLDVDVIVADLDGELAAGADVLVTSTRLEWRFEGGQWNEVAITEDSCEIVSDTAPQRCEFVPENGGTYRITATVRDDFGRRNLTEITRWVPGGTRPENRRLDLEEATLIPEGESWQPGDVARVLVQSPFGGGDGVAVITRVGIDRTFRFEFDEDGTALLEIPITEDDVPGIGLQVEIVGTATRTGPDGRPNPDLPLRPAFAAGQLTLSVPPDGRELTIDVAPRVERLSPGSETQIDVAVTDAAGEPVSGAELAVVVVDEAVLSLSNYELANPLDAFYPAGNPQASVARGRATVVLSDPALAAEQLAAEGGFATDAVTESAELSMADDAGDTANFALQGASPEFAARSATGAPAAPTPIELRTNFDALAVFEPEVTTDSDGRAVIDVPLPDNLTRYRVMVVATAATSATDAGTGESNITARLPVTVRPTAPRFMNFGDQLEFPVVVQNATDEDLDVDVAFRSTNLSVDGRDGATVRVPANDRVEVRFDVSADEAGTARFQIAASSGSFADAAEGSFPVYTPATAEAFATYGVVDDGVIAQPFAQPQGVFPQFGGLEISTSSTALSTLTDAVIYMDGYSYNSADGLSSRIISITALSDVLAAFDADELASPDELRERANADIEGLIRLQNRNGGFAWWVRGRDSNPYASIHATHALVLANQDGYDVPDQALNQALAYLSEIESFIPTYYSERYRRSLRAYATHVRWLSGDRDLAGATAIYGQSDDDQLDVAAWLWPVLAETPLEDDIATQLTNRVTETPNAATFATDYGEDAYLLLHSDRRTDAIVLDSLIRMRPDSDLVLKTLNGLLAARGRSGYWRNAQENTFVILAGSAYFEEFENIDPNFIAQVWLGDTYAVEQAYQDRSTDVNATLVPMNIVVDTGDTDIVVAKDGADGRLYYRLGLRYAPTDFELEPRDQGFVVDRTYEAIDDPEDVVRNDDGSWTVKAGARVRVRLTMVADSRRTHVALIDPMPAGFEAVNSALATSEPIGDADPAATVRSFWWYRWFDHQNLRDDRAEAFATWLGAGSYEYTYVTRATIPGTFVVPPTRAEQIHEPEVFGRSSNTTVTIVD